MLFPGFPSGLKASKRSPRSRRRARQFDLEALEQRQVPTVMFLPNFGPETVSGTNDGMQNPTVDLIFSGSYWTTKQGQLDEATLLSSAKNILSGPYLSGLTQYGSDGRATFGTYWQDNATVPSNPQASAVQNFLQTSITNHNAAPGSNNSQHAPIYVSFPTRTRRNRTMAAGTRKVRTSSRRSTSLAAGARPVLTSRPRIRLCT
jgi:hypothetical protein